MDWLWTIVYGFLAGLAEFLPVSSQAHQNLAAAVFGLESSAPLRQFLIRAACLAALLACCRREISKLQHDRRNAKIPARRRTRPVDSRSIATLRLLKTASIPMVIGLLFYQQATQWVSTLAVLALVLLINGVLLFLPQYVRSGNKDARTMSRMDGVLMGIAGSLSVFPGISRIGAIHFVAAIRGADKSYALQFALLLSIPAIIALLVFDAVAVFSGIEKLSFAVLIQYALAMTAAYLGSRFAISTVRSLTIRTGYFGFAYYCWGMALISMILFLTT